MAVCYRLCVQPPNFKASGVADAYKLLRRLNECKHKLTHLLDTGHLADGPWDRRWLGSPATKPRSEESPVLSSSIGARTQAVRAAKRYTLSRDSGGSAMRRYLKP